MSRRTVAVTAGVVVLIAACIALWVVLDGDDSEHGAVPSTPLRTDRPDVFGSETGKPGDEGSGATDDSSLGDELDARASQRPGGSGQEGDATRTYTITTSSSDRLSKVGWRVIYSDYTRTAENVPSTRDTHTSHDPRAFAQILAIGGPADSRIECTIAIDGKVMDHNEASGPWAQVFCQA